MMSREYPDWFDPRKVAEGRRTFAGSVPLARMERLLPLLASSEGEARFVAKFEFDGQGRVTILMEVEADLPLVCQRSLEPYMEPIGRRSLLGVIEDVAEEALMPDNYEPVLMQQGRLAMLELVEDELLLGLPQIPRNPSVGEVLLEVESGNRADPGAGDDSFRQPFAGLAEQLKKHLREGKN